MLNDTLHVRVLAEWAAEGEEGHIPPSEGGRLLSPFREVAAGALLSCGGQLLGDLDQASYSGDIAEIWRRCGGDIGEM